MISPSYRTTTSGTIRGACERLGERSLSVAGSASQKDPVARLKVVRPKKVGTVMFLDKFIDRSSYRTFKDKVGEGSPWVYLVDQV